MRWNYYKLRRLSLLQSAIDGCYKLRRLFYYKVRHGILQIATGITKCEDLLQIATGITRCDDYYKLRQYTREALSLSLSLSNPLQLTFLTVSLPQSPQRTCSQTINLFLALDACEKWGANRIQKHLQCGF